MTYLAIILSVLSAAAAWIYKLITENKNLKEKAANDAANEKVKEWSDQIKKLDDRISEEEKDYEEKRNKFISDNPDKPNGQS